MEAIKFVKDTVNHLFWTLVLQGTAFIVLAVLIVLYPALLFAIVAASFFILGILLLAFALKVRAFWGRVPNFLK
ncbi:MAG: hypothetical protein ACREGJ_01655 [Candidatus Saccharimonadales bacterium]